MIQLMVYEPTIEYMIHEVLPLAILGSNNINPNLSSRIDPRLQKRNSVRNAPGVNALIMIHDPE